MPQYKVRARLGDQTHIVEIERGSGYGEFKSRIETSFGGKPVAIRTDSSKPLYQDIHLKEVLKDLERSGAKYLSVVVTPEGWTPPSTNAAPIAPRSVSHVPVSTPPSRAPSASSPPVPAAATSPTTTPSAPAPSANHCNSCLQLISGQGIRALGGAYHAECFVCNVCGKSLMDGMFNQHEGKLYCANDYVAHLAEKCDACRQPITSAFLNISGVKYHPECFVCYSCNKPFQGSYTTKAGKPYHASCAQL